MKKLLFTFAIALISAMPLTARQLSETEALARVQTGGGRHAAAALNQGVSPRLIATRTAKSGNALYVFTTPGSTMFVSADDVAIPLLGYTDAPLENLDNIPPAMKWWIDQYVRQIDYVLSHPRATTTKAGLKTPVRKAPQKAGRKDIAPLLSTTWDQGAPYNNQCPALNGATTYTGCVATAMAQAMYYHKWPAKGTGSKTYYWEYGNKNLTASLNVSFDWNNMLLTYPDANTGTATQRNAVATLMKACGYAVEMEYGGDDEGGSGALTSNISNALIDNFGYDAATAYERRDYFPTATWERLVYDDLANVGPVIYGGQGDMGGHCFVCDGYSASDNKFHINWGWSGDSDGYFALDALDPEDLGAGGGGGGFDYGQDAVFGLRKPVAGSTRQPAYMAAEGYLDATASGRNVTMTCGGDMEDTGWGFVNMSAITGTFNIGVRIYSSTGATTYVTIKSNQTLVPYEGFETLTFTVPSSIGNGDYKITPVYQLKGSSIWMPMRYYVDTSVESLDMNVSGNNVEISGGISVEVPEELYVMMSEPMPTFETGKTSTFRTTIINEHDKEMTVTLYAALCLEYDDKPGLIFPDDTARGTDVTFTVPAGETIPVDFNITIPADYTPGNYYLGFVYDSPFAYGINNYDNYYVDVIKGSGVDPTPSTGDPLNVSVSTANNQTVYIGETNTIRATLHNSDANKVTLPLYAALCTEEGDNLYILENASGKAAEYTVNGGSTATVNIPLPVGADVEEGEYFLAFVYEPDIEDLNLMNDDLDCYVTAVRRAAKGSIAVDNVKLWFTAKDNNTIQRDLSVTGTSLTGNIALSLQGDNAAYYSLSTSSLPPAGGKVTVTFDPPLADGDYTCTLLLSANGASDVEVSLKGTRQGGDNPPAPAKPDALGKLNSVWSYSQTEGNLATASWFASASPFTRSMAVIGNNLYVLNAHPFKTNPAIHVIDADKGTFKETLMADGAGIETGTNYNSASVLGVIDGDLILVNATRSGHNLRIYKFTGGQGSPVKLLDKAVGDPLLTNMGEHAGIANGRIAFCDGSKVVYFEMSNGVLNSTPKTITLAKSIGSNGSRYQARFEEDGTFWLTHKDAAPVHYNASGAVIEQLGSSVLSSTRGTDACTFAYGNHKYMAAVATDNSVTSGWGNGHLELLRITDGIAGATNEGSYPAAGLGTANWGGSAAMSQCAVQISGDNQGTAKFWILVPQQGIAHFRYDASTTAVNDIAADSAESQAEIEYYNLQGVRMRPETLAPGIYIRRQGNTVTKVMIK